MIRELHRRWRNISRLWLGILMFGSLSLFFAACIWWDQTLTLERSCFFILFWTVMNLLRGPGPDEVSK